MKSPDEIKKGLVICCYDGSINKCVRCPYSDGTCGNDLNAIEKDALALIRQLEDHLRETTKKVEQLEAERDEAVADLKRGGNCFACKNWKTEVCFACQYGRTRRFEWRGVQKEATP